MTAPRRRIDVQREAPLRDAYATVHGNAEPKIANSPVALRIEERMRARLGPVRNVKAERKGRS